jgi:hypothetical protein
MKKVIFFMSVKCYRAIAVNRITKSGKAESGVNLYNFILMDVGVNVKRDMS